MANPTTRAEFKEYCLRRLGKPVIEINVDEDQLEDRVDEAIAYYQDYHFDGTSKDFIQHQITDDDKTNKYVTIPETVIGVTNIFDIGDAIFTQNLFNLRYQFALNDFYDTTNVSLIDYRMAMERIQFFEEILVGKQPIRYNRHKNQLHVDMDWDKAVSGQYMIIECYRIVDPDTYTDVWKDRWLLRYATALIKRQWGENLSKFSGMQLPGGLTFNGDTIKQEANQEIDRLEEEMTSSYSLPVNDLIG